MNPQLPHPAYRPDVDGLRAIAVSSVVVYHVAPAYVPGGFSGVDVFFVISGYLISTILFGGLDRGTFSMIEFYARRARRIFPALIATLVATFLFGWLVLVDSEFRALGKHIAAGAFFVSNFVLRSEAGYFDTAAELKPLLHLWSLGIEEQYYIVWPLVLLAAFKLRKSITLGLLVALLLFSFALGVARAPGHPVSTFFLPPTRIWELLLGSLLAYLTVFRGRLWMQPANVPASDGRNLLGLPRRLQDLLSLAGLALIAIGLWGLDKSKVFPGWWALPPTVGTFLLIASGPNGWANRRLLSGRFAIFLGQISFPLYLWHWPVLFFVRLLAPGMREGARGIAVVLLSTFLAWITYKYVEGKLRFSKAPSVPILLSVALAVIGGIGFAAYKGTILPRNDDASINKIFRAIGEWDYPGVATPGDVLRIGTSPRKVLFLGDSNIEQYWPRVERLVRERKDSARTAIFLTSGGCPPIPQVREAAHPNCDNLFDNAHRHAEDPAIEAVVIAASWSGYFAKRTTYFIEGAGTLQPGSPGNDAAFRNLSALVGAFRENRKDVYLILQIPQGQGLGPQSLFSRRLLQKVEIRDGGVGRSEVVGRMGNVMEKLREIGERHQVKVIDPLDVLCDARVCPAVMPDGEPIYKDGAHLRPSFVREHIHFLDEAMLGKRTVDSP